MLLSLVTALASQNVAFARGKNTWPSFEKHEYVEYPKKNAMPYFNGDLNVTSELTPDDIKVNIKVEQENKVSDLLEAAWNDYNSYATRKDIPYSSFGKFQLTYAYKCGMIGFLDESSPYAKYLPFIPAKLTSAGTKGMDKGGYGSGGRAFHFFDYPGDTSGDGDDDFIFTFEANLSKELRQAAMKDKNLEVNLVVEMYDTNGDHAKAALGYYLSGKQVPVTMSEFPHTENHKWKQWRTGWKYIQKDTSKLVVNLYSVDGSTGADANDAEVKMPRVILRDINKPKAVAVTIQTTGLKPSANTAYDPYGTDLRYRAKAGDDIKYIVTFDEPVRCTDVTKPVLLLSRSDGSTLKAYMDPSEKKDENKFKTQFTFHYTLQEGDNILRSGKAEALANGDAFLDVGGNPGDATQKGFEYVNQYTLNGKINEGLIICDSSSPYIPEQRQEESGGFYASKIDAAKWSGEAFLTKSTEQGNSVPGGLKASESGLRKYSQNTVFSLNSLDKPIFRVVLTDMIDNRDLKLADESDPLKLKLNIFDSKGNVISGRNAYAELIAYRYVGQYITGVDKTYQGTNNGYTELYFAYTPKAADFQGLNTNELYSVDIAAVVSDGKFIFGSDLFSKELKDFAGNKVGQLSFPANKLSSNAKAPANNIVKIDISGPVFRKDMSTLPDSSPVYELSNVKLVFEEKSSVDNVEIQIYKRSEGTGDLKLVRSNKSVSYGKLDSNNNLYFINIKPLTIDDDDPAESDRYYLVYTITDSVNNVTTNFGNGIPVNFDVLPPVVVRGSDGKWYTVKRNETGETADVTFRVEDQSGLEKYYSYIDYESNRAYNGDPKPVVKQPDESVTVTTDRGTRQNVTVWVKFEDTVGNKTKEYLNTEPINLDTRKIDAEFYCDYCMDINRYGTLQKTYDLYIKINKNPFKGTGDAAKEGILKIRYKWVPTASEKTDKVKNIEFEELSYTSEQVKDGMLISLTPEGFQQKWLKKSGDSGTAFQGKYKCYAEIELVSEMDGTETQIDSVNLSWHEHYFDNTKPVVAFQLPRTYAKEPAVSFSIDDNGSSVTNGSNIDFDIRNTYYTYAVKRTDESGKNYFVDILPGYINKIDYVNFSKKENGLGGKGSTDGKIIGIDETSVYLKVTVQDKAGNKAEGIIGGPVLIDIKAPAVNEFTPVIREGAKNIVYQNDTETYIVVKSLSDITGATLNITDNTSADITVAGISGSKIILKCDEDNAGVYSGTISLSKDDFKLVEKDGNGAEYYCATLTVSDEAQNTTYIYLNVIADDDAVYSQTPDASWPSNNGAYTSENVTARQYIYINNYETADMLTLSLNDPNGKAEGAPVIAAENNLYYIELTLKENTTSSGGQPSDVYVTVTDALGNVSEKIYFTARGIDRTLPAITVTPLSENTGHEGRFTVEAYDNEYLDSVDVALMNDGRAPEESDYFTSVWPLSTLLKGMPENSENNTGYAPSYAKFDIPSVISPDITGSFEYRCLQTDDYTLYVRARDKAGNESIAKYSFKADNSAPEVWSVSYSPSGMKTGGSVSVLIETDQPVTIQKEPYNYDEGSSIYRMQDMVRDFMLEGFTYRYKGEEKTISLMELEMEYINYYLKTSAMMAQVDEEAEKKFVEPIIGPVDEERFENDPQYALEYSEKWFATYYDEEFNKKIEAFISNRYHELLMNSGLDEDIYLFGDIQSRADTGNSTEIEELKEIRKFLCEVGIDLFSNTEDVYSYTYNPVLRREQESTREEKINKMIEETVERVNSYYKETENGIDINEDIFTISLEYIGYYKTVEVNDPELQEYAKTIYFFRYPEEIDVREPETADEYEVQELRKYAVTMLSEEYANMGKTGADSSFKTENIVTYRNNVDETLYAVNKYGQATPFVVTVNNIDHANAPSYSPMAVGLVYKDGDDTEQFTANTVKKEDVIRFILRLDPEIIPICISLILN